VLVAFLAHLALASAPQDSGPAGETLLRAAPAGTVLAAVCDDVPGLVAGLRRGPLGLLWDDEAFAPLRAQLDEALVEVWQQEVYPGGPHGGELIAGLEAAALFVGPFEGDEPEAGAFVLAVRDELAHELAAMLAAEAASSELIVVEGLEFQVAREDDGTWVAAGEWLRGLVFAFGTERDAALGWAHDLVTGLEAEPGAATADGARLAARRVPGAALEAHLDVGALFRSTLEQEQDPEARALLERVGLAGLGWASLSFASYPDGALETRATFQVPPDGLVGRWLSLMRPAPLDLGRLAPPGTIEATFAGLDADGLWRGALAFLAELDLAGEDGQGATPAQLLEQRLDEVEALIGIDLREAVFENLTGAFARFVLPDDVAYAHAPDAPLGMFDSLAVVLSGVVPQVGAVQVVGLRDGAAMEDLIDALIALSGADARIVEEQVGEHWMQALELDLLPFPGVSPCWAVLDDALLISGGRPSLRAVLTQASAEDARSWLDGPRAQRARALVDAGATLVTLADLPAITRRRVLRPLREFDAALDSKAYGSTIAAALQSVVPAAEGEHAEAVQRFRGQLQLAVQAGERLCANGLSGSWISTLTWAQGEVRYRSWTEPEQRD